MKKDPGPFSMSGKLMRVSATRSGGRVCAGCVYEHDNRNAPNRCNERRCRFFPVEGDDPIDYVLIYPADRPIYELAAVKFKLTEDQREWEPFIHRQSLKGRST